MLGDGPTDMFVHMKSFTNQTDRDIVQQHGLEEGDNIVFNVKRPRKASKSHYEAANVGILTPAIRGADDTANRKEIPTDPMDTPPSGSASSTGRTHGQATALQRRITDLHSSWVRSIADDPQDDLTTHGTWFLATFTSSG